MKIFLVSFFLIISNLSMAETNQSSEMAETVKDSSPLSSFIFGEEVYSKCCKTCIKGCACGNSCISCSYTCTKPRGCACDG